MIRIYFNSFTVIGAKPRRGSGCDEFSGGRNLIGHRISGVSGRRIIGEIMPAARFDCGPAA